MKQVFGFLLLLLAVVCFCVWPVEAVEQGEITGYCAELNICNGSCINGPNMPQEAPSMYKRRQNVKTHAAEAKITKGQEIPCDLSDAELTRTFESKASKHPPVNVPVIPDKKPEKVVQKY